LSIKSKIEKIVSAIKDSNISEIEITNFWGFHKIKLKTNNSSSNTDTKSNVSEKVDTIYNHDNFSSNKVNESNNIETEISDVANDIVDNNKKYTIINAPLVGTFYQSAKPGDKPFVEVGSKLKVGDSLCIIEAMKIFNTIESEFDGEIKEIFIQDGEPIEFGQALFSIDTN
jgi:acetyl-CoA carboxylase biotin carboxyl carrier protein